MNPFFQEVAHIPFWAYDPRMPDCVGAKRDALAQTIDIAPTVFDFFGIDAPADVQGHTLTERMRGDDPVRAASIYGVMGGHVNVTDGQYTYMRGPVNDDNRPLYDYTLMPTHLKSLFHPSELQKWEKVDGYSFMKGCQVMKIPTRTAPQLLSKDSPMGRARLSTLLFDVQNDPGQTNPLTDEDIEARMIELMLREMARNESPREQYQRLGLPEPERTGTGHGDDMIEMPDADAIRAACVLNKDTGREAAAHGGEGLPKLPFHPRQQFPDNLRLRPGYVFSQTEKAPAAD